MTSEVEGEENYNIVSSPEEDIDIHNLAEEVPETVPVPQDAADRKEPNPENFDDWSGYAHDLLQFEIGYPADADGNGLDPNGREIDLEGNIVDVTAEEEIYITYKFSDHLLENADYPIEDESGLPDVWAKAESVFSIEYDADSFVGLRERTQEVAEYIRDVEDSLARN